MTLEAHTPEDAQIEAQQVVQQRILAAPVLEKPNQPFVVAGRLRTVFGEHCTNIVLHFVEVGRSGQGDQARDQPDIFYGSEAVGSV